MTTRPPRRSSRFVLTAAGDENPSKRNPAQTNPPARRLLTLARAVPCAWRGLRLAISRLRPQHRGPRALPQRRGRHGAVVTAKIKRPAGEDRDDDEGATTHHPPAARLVLRPVAPRASRTSPRDVPVTIGGRTPSTSASRRGTGGTITVTAGPRRRGAHLRLEHHHERAIDTCPSTAATSRLRHALRPSSATDAAPATSRWAGEGTLNTCSWTAPTTTTPSSAVVRPHGHAPAYQFSEESVQECQVTNGFSAEFGRAAAPSSSSRPPSRAPTPSPRPFEYLRDES